MTFGEFTATADAFLDRSAGVVGVLSERDAADAAKPIESLATTIRALLDHANELDRAVRRTHLPTRAWAIAAADALPILDRALTNLRVAREPAPGTPGTPRAIAARYLTASARGAGFARDLLQTHFTTEGGRRVPRSPDATHLASPQVSSQLVALAGAWSRRLGEVCDLIARQTQQRPAIRLNRERRADEALRAAANALAMAGRTINARVGRPYPPQQLQELGTHPIRRETLHAPTSDESPATLLDLAADGATRLRTDHTDTRRPANYQARMTVPAHAAIDLRFVALAAASTFDSAAIALRRIASDDHDTHVPATALREACDPNSLGSGTALRMAGF